jgi:ribosomal protein S18 acetylase RimI-like enzyme
MYRIEKLSKSHDRKAFDCGTHPALNIFLQQQARQQSAKDASRTFVLVDDAAPQQIIGFFTLVATEVEGDQLPPEMSKKYDNPVGAARLARLAVDKSFQRKGIGAALLGEVMQRIMILAEHVGMVGLFVDAKDAEAKRYYEQYGFEALQQNPKELFLPIGTIRRIVNA